MLALNAKRQRIMASFFCFSFSLVIMASCAPVTISGLVAQTNTVLSLIELGQRLSALTANSVDNSYQDLGEQIRNKNFSIPAIQTMEVKYSEMSTKHHKLTTTLNNTSTEANKLFSMLQSNTDKNSTPELKSKMLSDLSTNRKAFDEKISVAEGVASKIEVSIKKYQDILGFLQNKVTQKDVDKYIETIDKTIANAKLLERDVRTALVEGRQIITQYEHTSPQKSNDDDSTLPSITTPTPTPNSTTTETPTTDDRVERPKLGIQMVTLTPELRQKLAADPSTKSLELDLDRGVLVTAVVENSAAAEAGIKVGDVITEITGNAVTDANEVTAEVGKSAVGADLTLQIRRDRQNLEIIARPIAMPNTSNVKENNDN